MDIIDDVWEVFASLPWGAILQWWGGILFLLSKPFLMLAEGATSDDAERKYSICGWSAYLLGVPAWLVILYAEGNWAAAFVEAGGVPGMLLGLGLALRGEKASKELKARAFWLGVGFAVSGVVVSVVDYGGLTETTQIFELGVTVGFLVGTPLVAVKNPLGWACYVLMNVSMFCLMFYDMRYIMAGFQLVSLGFVLSATIMSIQGKEILPEGELIVELKDPDSEPTP